MRGARGPLHQDDPCVPELLSPKEAALKADEAFVGGSGYRLLAPDFLRPFGSPNERHRARLPRVGLDNGLIRCRER